LVDYDELGKEVKSLFTGHQTPGNYLAEFDGGELAIEINFCILIS